MTLSGAQLIKAASNRISARARIAIGQVALLVGVLWMAIALGLVPSERNAAITARAKYCEALAIYASAFVEHGDIESLDGALRALAQRDNDIQSSAVRDADGKVIIEVGQHVANWGLSASAESHIYVPIFAGDKKWGTIEVRFTPIDQGGLWGYLKSSQLRLIAFVASVTMVLYLIYLRKMLQHLDPSKVVPPRVRSALDTLAEGLVVVDNDERIVLANQAFASLVGREPDALLGVRVSSLSWSSDRSPENFPWSASIRLREPQHGVAMQLTDHTGAKRTFTVNCTPVLGNDGGYRGVLASFDDVTLLEQKEVELRKSKEAAESANRAKSEFLARMSHEIRTPMNAILGFAEVLRRGYEENEEERQEYLNTIHSSGQHLLQLINDILDLSKIEAGKLEIEHARLSPHKMIVDTLSILSVKAKQKDLELGLRWESPVPELIESDPTRLRQVITNLVGNAIKFTDAGSVQLVARVVNYGATGKLIVDIIDTGVGMKPEALERIFKPFAQADTSITRRFGGTGLGLSISQQIVNALGGNLTVRSEYGKGSVFTMSVDTGPLANVKFIDPSLVHAVLETIAKPVNVLRLPPCNILLVEDGASNRKLISLVLERAGATLAAAENGRIGADMALAAKYDVILMDMQMPVMDGYTAARLLRDSGLATPIIALTAHAMAGDEDKCRAAGCSGFLTKPIDMDLLVRTVAEALGAQAETVEVSAPSKKAGAAAGKTAQASADAAENSLKAEEADHAEHVPMMRSSLPSDDPEFAEIILEFIDRLHQQLGAMEGAWQRQDLSEVASLAHWLKGSGGTAGFNALTDPARQLEMAAREKRLEEVGVAIKALQQMAERIEAPVVSGPMESAPV